MVTTMVSVGSTMASCSAVVGHAWQSRPPFLPLVGDTALVPAIPQPWWCCPHLLAGDRMYMQQVVVTLAREGEELSWRSGRTYMLSLSMSLTQWCVHCLLG